MRKLFSLATSAPKEGLYIESGKLPIRFLVMTRRIMYYWHILQREDDELIHRFMSAQQIWTDKNDWVAKVKKNMSEIQLNLTDVQIKALSNEEFKRKVKLKVEIFAYKYVKKLQHSHSKTSELEFDSFCPSEYLVSPYLSKDQVKLLYKLRNYMIDVKLNFGSMHKENPWCRTCFMVKETQQHLLNCPVIIKRLENVINLSSMRHCMLFKEIEKQIEITNVFSVIIETRTKIIEENRNPP